MKIRSFAGALFVSLIVGLSSESHRRHGHSQIQRSHQCVAGLLGRKRISDGDQLMERDCGDKGGKPCLSQNEVYDMCNAQCEPSCADPEPICTKICTGGCVCASGLLRDESGECVSVERCSRNATNPGLLSKYLNVINKILHLSVV
ncbi:Cysteine-rich venom protein 6 [Eumeta japonica]|uniref:Cysteine-rich venom protein 6 n=1 Tax=Eumeta variegata TaxID=151549 RepID=A0A4C1UXB0_EUMVA|nr:Cysteine-rich venom protein 6 [Eumeta japonica]